MSIERRKDNKFIVYTDIVGHTKMFGRVGAPFRAMRERHDQLFMEAIRAHAPNAVVKGSGDGFYAAIDEVKQAIEVATLFRRGLVMEDWNRFLPAERQSPDNIIRCRIGLHCGLVNITIQDEKGVDFDGQPRSVAEKVMSAAVGNQILITRQVRDAAASMLERQDDVKVKKFGEYKLRELAETVEIWGLCESDYDFGPKPVQSPEHRVIIFAVIHDQAQVSEEAGPKFEAAKDAWDAAFMQAVSHHAEGAFVKAMPDGSLGAFRNALEATRAAREFRRLFKQQMRDADVKLQPKIALDSGLVTFDYLDNRAIDVRDQPVNIAAKICKLNLAAPWQLILTRAVREDAFANLPERDELKWVCLGGKQIAGEPEPVELWDFQDVQIKAETRTLLWIDCRNVRDLLRNLPDVYAVFRRRLEEIVKDIISRRTEDPWMVTHDSGLALAFKDPVEAVHAAIDLRKASLEEAWERYLTGFKRGSREDNLMRLAMHTGQVRLTLEDGLLKEFKGAAVDGVRPIADVTKNSQIIVSRELKETVATAFPASEVKWRKVTTIATGATPIEAFELRRVKKVNPVMIAGAGVGVLALIVALVMFLRPPGGISVNDWKPGLLPPDMARVVTGMKTDDDLRRVVPQIEFVVGRLSEPVKYEDRFAFFESMAPLTTQLQTLYEQRATLDMTAFKVHMAKLDAINKKDELEKWLTEANEYLIPVGADGSPLPNPTLKLPKVTERDRVNESLADKVPSAETTKAEGEFKKLWPRIDAIRTHAWVKRSKDQLEKDVTDATAEWKAFLDRVAALPDKPVELSMLPSSVSTVIETLQRDPTPLVKDVARRAAQLMERDMKATTTPGAASPEQRFAPITESLRALPKQVASLDVAAIDEEYLPEMRQAGTVAELATWMKGLDQYKVPAGDKPKDTEAWLTDLRTLTASAQRIALKDPKVEESLARAQSAIQSLQGTHWVVKHEAKIKEKTAAVEAEIGPKGAARVAIEAAEKQFREQNEKASQRGEASRMFNELIAKTSVVSTEWSVVNAAWNRATAGMRARFKDDTADAMLAEAKDISAAIETVPGVFAATLKVQDANSSWETGLSKAVSAVRDGQIETLLKGVDGTKPFDKAVFSQSLAKAREAYAATLKQASGVAQQATALEAAMNLAKGLGDKVADGGPTIEQAGDAIAKSEVVVQNAEIKQALVPVTSRVDRLKDIRAAKSLKELNTLGMDARTIEAVAAVWARMGDAAVPMTADALTLEDDVYQKLAGMPIAADAKRQEQVRSDAAAARPARWVRYFEAADNEQRISDALRDREKFGVTAGQIDALSPSARYNYLLASLRQALQAPDGPTKEASVRDAVDAILTKDVGTVRSTPKVGQMLVELRTVGGGGKGAGAESPPDQIGPGLAGFKLVDQKGDALVYEMNLPASGKWYIVDKAPRIEFVKLTINNDGSPRTVYMSTTEVSAGLFMEVVAASQSGFNGLRSYYSSPDFRQPGVWRFAAAGQMEMLIGRDRDGNGATMWTVNSPDLQNKIATYYPKDPPPGPTIDHPMQYVTIGAATYLARLMQCRLPSSSEWRSALETDTNWRNLDVWNLRDDNVDQLVKFRAAGHQVKGTSDPDIQAFPKKPVQKCRANNDSYLWFAKVDEDVPGANHRFHNLIGNVAEWTFEEPAKLDSLWPPERTTNFVSAQENVNLYRVVGASALSQVAEPDEITKPIGLASVQNSSTQRGWSDVGFRLAFNPQRPDEVAQEEPYMTRVARIIADAAYVAPGGGAGNSSSPKAPGN